jgi:hypothetical protein
MGGSAWHRGRLSKTPIVRSRATYAGANAELCLGTRPGLGDVSSS